MRTFALVLSFLLPLEALSAQASEEGDVMGQEQFAPRLNHPAAEVAGSSAGLAGRRERSDGIRAISPTARISNRLQNRVQTRLRTRIDRYYQPQSNAADPFGAAEDELRSTGRPPR